MLLHEDKMIDAVLEEAVRSSFPNFEGELSRETTAADVPGWDSFGHIQLVMDLEDRSGKSIDLQRTLLCRNLGELNDVLRGDAT